MIDPQFQNLPPGKALEAVLHYESEADHLLATGKIDQWQAWEMYFALMYECNVRALAHPEMEK